MYCTRYLLFCFILPFVSALDCVKHAGVPRSPWLLASRYPDSINWAVPIPPEDRQEARYYIKTLKCTTPMTVFWLLDKLTATKADLMQLNKNSVLK